MSNRPSEQKHSKHVTRRSLLAATAVSAAFHPALLGKLCLADPPNSTSTQQLAARTAVRRVIRQTGNRTVRLEPISTDFDRTTVCAIATDPRSEIVAVAGDDHAIRILDAASLRVLKTLKGHTDLIRSLDFDPVGGRMVSAGNDGQLILWDRIDDFSILQRMQGTPALACVRFAPDGMEMAAVGFGSDLYLIGQDTSDQQPRLDCECNDLRALAYRDDGKLLTVSGRNGHLTIFDRKTNQSLGEFNIHNGRVHELIFAESSPVVVSVGEDGDVVLFDTDARQTLQRINVTSGKLFSVTLLDRTHLAVAGSDNVIRIVNVTLGRVVEELTGHTGSIAALESDGSLLFSGGYDATMRRWQLSGVESSRERIAERDQIIDR